MIVVGIAKKSFSSSKNAHSVQNPKESKLVCFVDNEEETENADGINQHLETIGAINHKAGFYEKVIKRFIDFFLSFGGLILLSPLFAILSFWIIIDDPGPILFTQKRIGRNKQYFKLHKFRSMKRSTPHDMPTHLLENPDQYITRVGRVLRKTSLDELPQIWNIMKGDMSIIGPRPALWNQEDLYAEREKYGANNIRPGLTGWAQINGRDELEIADKAKLDGEYVQKMSFAFDVKCFVGTIFSVLRSDGVVEGGTGEIKKNKTEIKKND